MFTGLMQALTGGGQAARAGKTLYAASASAARRSFLYADLGAPDTVEGRFELYSLHAFLVIRRLRSQPDKTGALSQALFDSLLRGLDDGLREMGVGDLSVGKKMRKLGEALYGRAKNLDEALNAADEDAALRAFLARTVFAGCEDAVQRAGPMAQAVRKMDDALGAQSLDRIMAGEVRFEEVTS